MRFICLFAMLIAANLITPAYAGFTVSPIIISLTPSGSGSNATLTVKNTTDVKTPVQISIARRNPDLEGNENYDDTEELDDLFQIYPAQLILGPKESRSVRISWIGDTKLTQELAFRMIAEELPFDLNPPQGTPTKPIGKVILSARYIGSLYITPVGATPNIIITGTASNSPSPKNLLLKAENKGSTHGKLTGPLIVKVTGTKTNRTIELPSDQVAKILSLNVLAGKTRQVSVPWPSGLADEPLKVVIEKPKK